MATRSTARTAPSRDPVPNAVLVWDPMEVRPIDPPDASDGWHMVGCLKDTRAGSRAVVYQTTEDQGLVRLYDFSSDAFEHPDLRWAAFGLPVEVSTPIPRATLLADPDLAPVFRHIQGRRYLPEEAQRALAALLGDLPPFAELAEPLPSPDEDWRWVPARGKAWGSEGAMRDAILGHEGSWRGRLGFGDQPRPEQPVPGSARRTDLCGPGVIAECKLMAGKAALEQLDDYLEAYRGAESAGRPWVGHLIAARGFTSSVAGSVFSRPDVRLWVCGRDGDRPVLQEVTEDNPPPSERPAFEPAAQSEAVSGALESAGRRLDALVDRFKRRLRR